MTADEARELLRLAKAEIAVLLPADVPTKPVIDFFRRVFSAQSLRDDGPAGKVRVG